MKTKNRVKRHLLLILIGGAIPVSVVLSAYFEIPQVITIPLLIILGIAFCTMALWTFANRKTDGSEWWHDDNASGWRGY